MKTNPLSGLDSLNALVDNSHVPSTLEFVYYLFWEKGIDLTTFHQLPLSYIFGILKAHKYVKDLEEKELKKAKRKK